MEHQDKTIFDVARETLQKNQTHTLPTFMKKGLEKLEQKAKENQADNQISAVIGTIPPELEDLSRILMRKTHQCVLRLFYQFSGRDLVRFSSLSCSC